MVLASRFGFAAAASRSSATNLAGALKGRLDPALKPLKEIFAAPFLIQDDGAVGTAILHSAQRAFDFAVALQEAAWPVGLRFTLAAAPPAGIAAKDDAVRVRAQKLFKGMERGAVLRADLPGRSPEECALADALARLHRTLTADWTEGRWLAVRSYRRHGRQADVAQELGVTQQAVSQMLLGSRLRDLTAAENALRGWLGEPRHTTLWPLKMRSLAGAQAGLSGTD